MCYCSVKEHYDLLIQEGDDPTKDSEQLKKYMNNWDGEVFLQELQRIGGEFALEIGIGTGRLALQTSRLYKCLDGVDLSPLTVKKAKENLSCFSNVNVFCEDILNFQPKRKYDIIYSSLTFMHIKRKEQAFHKIALLLKKDGGFVLSIDKAQKEKLCCGERKVKLYPDSLKETEQLLKKVGFCLEKIQETPSAYIITALKK